MVKSLNLSNITQKWIDLLVPFTTNYSLKISASGLSRKTNIPQQTASRYLNKLVKLNLLDYVKEGKNKLFYFDLEKATTKTMLNSIENQKTLQFQLKAKESSVIIEEFLHYCESLIAFGSYASGNFTEESDLDLIILDKCDKDQIKKIKNKQVIAINEHYASYNEFIKLLDSRNPLGLEIVKNHILFGDVCKMVDIFWRREYERR